MVFATLIRVAIILKCTFQKAKKLLYCAYLKSWFVRVSVNPCFQSVRFERSGSKEKKKNHSKSNDLKWFTWQREKDSNPHIRSQSPLCYLYTIPLNAKSIIQTFSNLSSIRRKLFL